MHLVILEGPRCAGKSTVATALRQQGLNYSTQINFTGFSEDGAEGLDKITCYYEEWLEMFNNLKGHDFRFICDRIFFSEMVYSQLVKSYDFEPYFKEFVEAMGDVCDKVSIFHLTVSDPEVIAERSKREGKVKFKDVGDSIEEVLKQKQLYDEVFNKFKQMKPYNTKLIELDTSKMSTDEVKNTIMGYLKEA